jgi:DNA-binding IclR family transcriptional regulator
VTSIAAPVRNSEGVAVAAVTVSGTTLSGAELEERARDQVLEAATLISVGLGFHSRNTAHVG